MDKPSKPQICVFNNSKIVQELEEAYIVSEGNIGSVVKAVYNRGESRRNFDFDYEWVANIHEYDICIIDLQEERMIKEFSHDDEPGEDGKLFRITYPKRECDAMPWAMRELNRVMTGKMMRIIFAGSPKNEDYNVVTVHSRGGSASSYSETIGSYDNIRIKSYDVQGKMVKIVDGPFRELLKKHTIGYAATFEEIVRYNLFEGEVKLEEQFMPLAYSGDEKIISFYSYTKDKGHILVLPLCKEKERLIKIIIDDVLPELIPELVPESQKFAWLENDLYKPEEIIALEKERRKLELEYAEKLATIEFEIKSVSKQYDFLKDLLTETGNNLVNAVKTYLEWLGFEDVRLPDGTENIFREDIQIFEGDNLYIIEVKGIGGTSTDSECAQINKHRRRREKEYRDKDVYAMYIVNHQRHKNPKLRDNPPFTSEQIGYAENDERGLLTTWTLYKMYHLIENGIFNKDEIRKAFKEYGCMELMPENIKHIGTITEYFKKPQAGILVLNNELSVDDEILCEKNGEWKKAMVKSIKLDDVSVNSSDSGEIGMVTNTELSKGYRIFKRY